MKTVKRFDFVNGYYKLRTLTRSFDSLEEAQAFAKQRIAVNSSNGINPVVDIYKSKGRFVVEWRLFVDNNN